MKVLHLLLLLFVLLIFPSQKTEITAQIPLLNDAVLPDTLPQMPVYFEANMGQVDSSYDFFARWNGHTLYLRDSEAIFVPHYSARDDGSANTEKVPLQLNLIDGNPSPSAIGEHRQRGTSHYLIGRDAEKWRTDVPHFGRVRYRNVYDGIDLIYYGNHQRLEYDFVLAPHADPAKIQLLFTPLEGLTVDPTGDLLLHTHDGTIRQHAPVVYQIINDRWVDVTARYQLLEDGVVGFEIGAYDPAYQLTIDPVIEYSTYVGGSEPDDVWDVAADNAGYAYLTGRTESADFVTSAGVLGDTLAGPTDAYVVKVDTNSTGVESLVYATYVGGNAGDHAWAIDIDASGNVYIAGSTGSEDFPVTASGFGQIKSQGVCCSQDGFLAKLAPDGSSLLYATYVGGTSYDEGYGVATDQSGNAYVVGTTRSETFPTTVNGFDIDPTNVSDEWRIFVSKIDTNASGMASLVYSTYFGGNDGDSPGRGIAADDSGNVYIAGATESTNFPVTPDAYRSTFSGVQRDAFLARFDTIQSGPDSLVYSTLVGGSHVENFNTAGSVACDEDGHAYITGETTSADFPIVNGFQTVFAGGSSANADAFVARFDTNASGADSLEYSTYLGGYGFDQGWGIAATRQGNVYVTGQTQSNNFPLLNPIQSVVAGDLGSFVTKIDTNASGLTSLVYSTYLGRGGNGYGGVAVDTNGVAYAGGQIAGQSIFGQPGGSPIFPILNGFQPTYGGETDGYLVRLGFDADVSVGESDLDDLLLIGVEKTFRLVVSNSGPETVTGLELTTLLPLGMNFVSAIPSQGMCENVGNIVFCEIGNLADGQSLTLDLTVIVPDAIVDQPEHPMTRVNWPGNIFRANPRHTMVSRAWHVAKSPAGIVVTRALAAPYGTPISADAAADGVERDPFAANNTASVTLNAIEGSVFSLSNEQVFNAIAAEINIGTGSEEIDFVLPVVGADGIDLTVRTTDGTIGQMQVTMASSQGLLMVKVENVTVNGNQAPGEFLDSVNLELPRLLTQALDTLIAQQAAPGYNLVRVTTEEHGIAVIVEE